jgi:hypothetical protein
MLDVWSQEQTAAQVTPMSCYQKSQVRYMATQVHYERTQVHYLDTQTHYALQQQIQPNINAANEGLDVVSSWAPELFKRAQAYAQLSGTASTMPDPSNAVASFRKQTEDSLNTYSERLQHFLGIVKDYDTRADDLDSKAHEFPDSLTCAG